jgi:tetratricopeptide (TPR) repeat protein
MLGMLFASADALADSTDDARAHIAKATRAHKEAHYEESRVELEAAFALDPKPDLLYAIAQVEAKLGRCDEATEHYRRFAATQSDPRVARVVEQAITACVPAVPAGASSEPAAAPPSTASERATVAAAPAQPERWYRDAVGGALVGGGAVAALLAIVEYRSALSDLDAAGDRATTTSLPRYHERVDSAHGKRTTALVLAGAGAALISAGVVRYVLHSRTLEAHEVAVSPARGGGIVSFGGRF